MAATKFLHKKIDDMMIVGETSLEEVHGAFKKSCPKMDYNGVMRNPDEYKNTYCQISGTIFQIILEGYDTTRYLLSTNAGYVYVEWQTDKKVRGSRLLENDKVTVYGQFKWLETYDMSTSSITVPKFEVICIE